MKHTKRLRLYHTSLSAAHLSFVMNSNEYPPKTIEDLCRILSGDKTGQRDCKTSITFFTSGSAIRCHDSKSKSNELGLLFHHRDLPHIQGSHIGIH